MNKEILKQYKDLQHEIFKLNKRLQKLKKYKIEHDFVSGSNTEFPYQRITIDLEGYADNSEKINKTQRLLEKRLKEYQELRLTIEEFIADIFDSRTRLIFEYRYINSWSWQRISMKLGSHDESYARKIHDRYLARVDNKCLQ